MKEKALSMILLGILAILAFVDRSRIADEWATTAKIWRLVIGSLLVAIFGCIIALIFGPRFGLGGIVLF